MVRFRGSDGGVLVGGFGHDIMKVSQWGKSLVDLGLRFCYFVGLLVVFGMGVVIWCWWFGS
jgi:hypothetical protein